MRPKKNSIGTVLDLFEGKKFVRVSKLLEDLVAKLLAIAMFFVIAVAVFDLFFVLTQELGHEPSFGFLEESLIEIFGVFLNVLIALEILENITSYLRNHAVQLELVIVTSLTAVARKIIVFKGSTEGIDLNGLAFAILALSISYWIIKRTNRCDPDPLE
ncbi:hypothetical protein Pse7367_2775 [Thalassoporum mexicanum PCC 7367]|uniref:phosphate-starvation-inducible PsiE family protein n=1 Tax=Thalassoporum mexicanum TaxID=3457544 RepID=UPI00029FE0BF|nr:phosphate-starvation-inducible PsiE family protein [Pseudanabaena sp. PCC 7367]AFY71029.1 hypothetical protein Pse7367_2775 [Pseudanabaena sp. PCC 7367]